MLLHFLDHRIVFGLKARMTVLEWLSHEAIIEADSPAAAEEEARRLWDENVKFRSSGIDGVEVDPL